jgi:signal transduction histidine kinase
MSLRLRLTLIYSALLSAAILLLGIVVFSMASMVMINQLDERLHRAADNLIENLLVDANGNLEVNRSTLNIDSVYLYQIWSLDGRLLQHSENALIIDDPIGQDYLGVVAITYSEGEIGGSLHRILTVPLVVDGQDFGWLQIGIPLQGVHDAQQLLLIVFSISTGFTIVLVGMIGWLVTGKALEPLEEMAQISKQITTSDDLSKRIPVQAGKNDEINALALSYNQTLVRLERLFNTQRRFLADVSHELRTPLTVMKGNVGLMRIMKTFDNDALKSIDAEVDRLTRLVGDLLLMAQAETGELPLLHEPVAMDELLFAVFEEMKVLSGGQHNIFLENIEPAIVVGDPDRLKQVLLNLGGNAVKYSPENTSIKLSLEVVSGWAKICFSDEGYGIPKEDQKRVFERFYRGDKARTRSAKDAGFGLGLPIAYWIARNHGGRIDVESEVGVGTTFTVWLPLSQADIPTRPFHNRKNDG